MQNVNTKINFLLFSVLGLNFATNQYQICEVAQHNYTCSKEKIIKSNTFEHISIVGNLLFSIVTCELYYFKLISVSYNIISVSYL